LGKNPQVVFFLLRKFMIFVPIPASVIDLPQFLLPSGGFLLIIPKQVKPGVKNQFCAV
jgi:hypothetical protein